MVQPIKNEDFQPIKNEDFQPIKNEDFQPIKNEDFQPIKNEDFQPITTIIYRFKFTEPFMEELYQFSKIHQYDNRKDFKEAWELWITENEELVDRESTRLLRLGYNGDILDKMFKSARYYFRKKSTIPKEPKQRRQYTTINNEILKLMDNHIQTNIDKDDYQPKHAFKTFCIENEEIVKNTIYELKEQGFHNFEEIENKIKKTYKNRYFMLVSK
jgi:hypothetical protein